MLPGDRVHGERPVRMPPGPGCPLHLSALPTLTLRPNYRTFADHSAHINIHKAEDAGAASHKAASLEDTELCHDSRRPGSSVFQD